MKVETKTAAQFSFKESGVSLESSFQLWSGDSAWVKLLATSSPGAARAESDKKCCRKPGLGSLSPLLPTAAFCAVVALKRSTTGRDVQATSGSLAASGSAFPCAVGTKHRIR
eukprot:gnl/TRDRNA2_/TRDRNA2_76688_c1_seq2.p2 gnl/TRDRNA2_/TRDRNA2_76688_c1~~gnl/TRDRNA2_/TRDRNA2_76688_c1_seq2.p2  ORF type:complete len:112 (+),score=12.05 gnl/TRDRNA2_/TRDRNA2_76688_c1_seq2:122-457(+)